MTHKHETQENVSDMNFGIASYYQHDVTENAKNCEITPDNKINLADMKECRVRLIRLNLSLKIILKNTRGQIDQKCGKFLEKSFPDSESSIEHIKTIRDGQSRYKCNDCGKCFSFIGQH